MFEVCSLSDSRACANVSGVCSDTAWRVRKSVYCESLNCETDFLLGGQVCTIRELSDLLSRLPWAARHVFDRSNSKRNDARAIVDALYLRTLHDEYSVSKSEEIYVVRSILDAALYANWCDKYKGVDNEIVWKIRDAYQEADERVHEFWSELNAESPNSSCDHYDDWCFKHPEIEDLWIAWDDAYDTYGHDDDANSRAREMLVRFGLIESVSDLPDEETFCRRARGYYDGTFTACAGERCLASRDRRECRSSVNECAYSACNSAAYHATLIDIDCDNYPKAVDQDARIDTFPASVSSVWCDTGSLHLHKSRAGVVCTEEYTWSQNYGWLRNACDYFDPSTCLTPAEGRKERARERRNARRREARYVRELKASVYRGERSVEVMVEEYANRWNSLQKYYLFKEERWQRNPVDRLRARVFRACATLVAAGESLMAIHANLRKIGYHSLDRVC